MAESVTSIAPYAFGMCKQLSAVTLPEGLVEIGARAFFGCKALRSVIIPAGVSVIKEGTFDDAGLTSISIPAGVTSIEKYAFRYTALTDVAIPEGVTSIGDDAFSNCIYLKEIEIPASVHSIGVAVFFQCKSLEAITVADENASYCSQAGVLYDRQCATLIWMPTAKSGACRIPDGVTEIAAYAFSNCEKLTDIQIPNSVATIGMEAFSGCSGLTVVHIPAGVTILNEGVFRGCSFTGITIPASVTSIGNWAFCDCTSLKNVIFAGDAPELSYWVFSYTDAPAWRNLPDLTIYYLEGTQGWETPTWHGYNTAIWNRQIPHEHSYAAISTTATCTQPGRTTYACAICGEAYSDFTDPLGHDWSAPTYTWTANDTKISATRVCKRDGSHVETEWGVITITVLREATFAAEGEQSYTATFSNVAFETQTKVVSLPKLEFIFCDVAEGSYYYDAVRWAVENNITAGTSATAFSPEATCTRAQIVTFLWRARVK